MIKNSWVIRAYMSFLLILFLTGCGAEMNTTKKIVEEMPLEDNTFLYVTELDNKTEAENPIYVNLSEKKSQVLIDKGGEYVLSGTCYYPLKVDAHDEIVHLFFDNVNIRTTTGPAIEIISGGKVLITLGEDSINTFFDAAYYSNDELHAAISSECDLTINGTGVMYVSGIYKDAIYTKDVLKILGGEVQVKSKRYGLRGNDGILLDADAVIIESEKNGCQTTNANKKGKGVVDVRNGSVSIVAGEYAISAVSDVYIRNGHVNMKSVIADIYTEGQQYIAEGTIDYE